MQPSIDTASLLDCKANPNSQIDDNLHENPPNPKPRNPKLRQLDTTNPLAREAAANPLTVLVAASFSEVPKASLVGV